jgi:hypothetical protein
MATIVGDNALAQRLDDMQALINRGIVKMQSLYLEVEQEPQRINVYDGEVILDFDEQGKLQSKKSSNAIEEEKKEE